ncbi:MAG: 50S ribosomal protein L30 [Prevotellaceae bacterium]|jgi:large subunit ribosomal protein L30|nr:50S ribosomal protein L30 [Prevotellaceae bacterium]
MAILKITQVRSQIGSTDKQKATLKSLKLGKINRSTEREENPMLRGMIKAVSHLVKVEEVKKVEEV